MSLLFLVFLLFCYSGSVSCATWIVLVVTDKHREGRLKQEMDNMRQQNDWLNKELQERIQELMNSRKEKVSYTFLDCY